MSVFRNLDRLSLVVCTNPTLLKLQTVLFLFFSKFFTSKSGVRLIYGCGLYTDVSVSKKKKKKKGFFTSWGLNTPHLQFLLQSFPVGTMLFHQTNSKTYRSHVTQDDELNDNWTWNQNKEKFKATTTTKKTETLEQPESSFQWQASHPVKYSTAQNVSYHPRATR